MPGRGLRSITEERLQVDSTAREAVPGASDPAPATDTTEQVKPAPGAHKAVQGRLPERVRTQGHVHVKHPTGPQWQSPSGSRTSGETLGNQHAAFGAFLFFIYLHYFLSYS